MRNPWKNTILSVGATLLCVCPDVGKAETVYDGPEFDRAVEVAKQLYAILAPKLAPTNVPFADIYRQPFQIDEKLSYIDNKVTYGKVAYIRGQFWFWLEQPSNKISGVWNPALGKFIETNDTQQVAGLTTNRAVEVAEGYLKTIGFKSKYPLILKNARFNVFPSKHLWAVHWEPTVDGYRFDSTISFEAQYVTVAFHEKYGFVSFAYEDSFPPPGTTELKVTREAAVAKGEKAVPLVMRTPFYLRCRDPNFKVKSLISAELLIAAPNWLLDPKRAIWIHDKPPDETRLCWVVTFDTVATKESSAKLIPPSILIYIDAATGEIVGANFT